MAQDEAYSTLMHGIKELTFKGPPVPSKLLLNGHHAFPLAVNAQDQVIIAASCYGLGRIVVMGHEVYLQDFPDLVNNALGWLQPSSGRPKVGVNSSCQAIVGNLSSVDAEVCQFRSDLGVYISDAYNIDPFAEKMVSFLKEGGGVLIAGQAWHWNQIHPHENVQHHFPGNKVSGVAGIFFTEHYGPHGSMTVLSQMPSSWSAMALEGSYSTLMHGIQEITFKGPPVPSELLLNGHHAFPLAVNAQDQVIIAASCYGLGRIVVMGHEVYLQDIPDLVKNALGWLQPSSGRAKVGVYPTCQAVVGNLSSSIDAEVCQFRSDLGVYVTDAYHVGPFSKELVNFLKEGGGVLIAGQAWHWHQVHPQENVLLNFTGNKVCSVAGIYFTEHYGSHGQTTVPPQIPLRWSFKSVKGYLKEDLDVLLDGVSEFDIRDDAVPSEVLVHGPLAFPIATTPDGRAFLAGSHYGQGHVIIATHETYLSHKPLSRFLINAVLWLDKGRKGLVGVSPKLRGATNLLSRSGLQCQVTDFSDRSDDLSVYVCTSYSDDHCNEIQRFVAEGGGLLIGGQAWYWSTTNIAEKTLIRYPGNHILNQMGLSILPRMVKRGLYEAQSGREFLEAYQFRQFLQLFSNNLAQNQSFSDDQQECLKKMERDCVNYLSMSAHDCASYSSVLEMLTDLVKTGKVPQVCESCPVRNVEDRLLLGVAQQVCKECRDPEALLPYIIKDIPALVTVSNSTVAISAKTGDVKEWISTGLYLSPGMRTNIKFPSNIVGKGWKVQIGCQTDNIQLLDEWKRAPVVFECFPVDSNTVQVWNLWGGLIYLVAPPKCQVDGVEILVEKAVRAPYYKSGETTVYQWLHGIRNYPAPWAELEFQNLVITLKSDFIRDLERPDLLAEQWDAVMRGVAELAAKPGKFPRKERFVADVQISAGFMHAGYPIMVHSSSAPDLLKLTGKKDPWGPIHELGHNQQLPVWEFAPHTGEATNNLWSVFICETVYGLKWGDAHPSLKPVQRQRRVQEYIKGGRRLEDWKVWTALETYLQLQEKFGWDAFKKFFGAYHNMPAVPQDKTKKMNTFVETFSKVVDMNLTSFFKAWGWPVEPATERKLSSLPDWTDHPMAAYI
ncbi:TRPM8 channel-associated factor homolog [Alosa pseudoharengus]|uniref:TRPM8 channel-associated factor homolog n=1 Tax=Alosa pseudoharengus TaxID=34774 RepID=UPI003F8890FB